MCWEIDTGSSLSRKRRRPRGPSKSNVRASSIGSWTGPISKATRPKLKNRRSKRLHLQNSRDAESRARSSRCELSGSRGSTATRGHACRAEPFAAPNAVAFPS